MDREGDDVTTFIWCGPFLRHTTTREATLWFATQAPLTPSDAAAEFWKPGFLGRLAQPEPVVASGTLNIIGAESELRSYKATQRLHVHLLRSVFFRPLQRGQVIAYRLLLRSGLGDFVEAISPPAGGYERLMPIDPALKSAPPFASFVLPDDSQVQLLSLRASAHERVAAADAWLAREIQSAQPATRSRQTLPSAVPSRLFSFGLSLNPQASLLAPLAQAVNELAASFDPSTDAERRLARWAAAHVLSSSPALWRASIDPTLSDTAIVQAGLATRASARLMSNVPTYVLDDTEPAGLDAAERSAYRAARVLFGAWGNDPSQPIEPARASSFTIQPFAIRDRSSIVCASGGDVTPVLRMDASRVAIIVSSEALVRRDTATLPAGLADELGERDDSIVVCMAPVVSYIAIPKGTSETHAPNARFATAGDGRASGRRFELALGALSVGATASGVPQPPAETATDGALDIQEAALPCFATLRRVGNVITLQLHRQDGKVQAFQLHLVPHGRLVPMPAGSPEGLHLGNRFRVKQDAAEAKLLAGVEIQLVARGTPEGPGGSYLVKASANGAALVPLDLSGVADDEYEIRFGGANVFTHAGPDTPIHTGGAAPAPRIWKKHRFAVLVEQQRIVQIDHEPVPDKSFRLLIDPVWMSAHERRKHRRSSQPPTVELVVLHRTDRNDARVDADAWVSGKGDGTSAHYLVARDGTTIKLVDETEASHHAGPSRWRGRPTSPKPSVNDLSVGIEISKTDDATPYTESQYQAVLALVRALLGRELVQPGRARNRRDVSITASATDLVGHSDIRWQSETLDLLGGRDDPGLAFDWGRFEAAGLGLQRTALVTPLFGAAPPGPATNSVLTLDPTWQVQMQRDEAEYDSRAEHRNDGHVLRSSDPIIRGQIYLDLTAIGYWSATTNADAERGRRINSHVVKPLDAAIAAFRSHFFSGVRRTRPKPEEETAELDRVTVIWIKRVRDHLRANGIR
jgi:N-acetyl-anhydromuramyl-L-alanine amidase AmpD